MRIFCKFAENSRVTNKKALITMKETMFYYSILLALLFAPHNITAQKLKDFQEAMKIPREYGKGYVLAKRFNDEKVRKVASENGFKIIGMNYKGCAMFVPLNEYDTYKFESDGSDYVNYFNQGFARAQELTKKKLSFSVLDNLRGYVAISKNDRVNKDLIGTDFKSKGNAYLFEDEIFIPFENVIWTGEVKNGMIDGKGDGFIVRKNKSNENEYRSFSGEFNKGFPKGKVIYARGLPEVKTGWFASYFQVSKEIVEVGDICDGLAKYRKVNQRNPLYGYIDYKGNIVISPSYKNAKDFSNGIAYVTPENTEVKIDKTGHVIALSENAIIPFDEMVKLKKEYPHLAKSVESVASKYIEKQLSYQELVKVEEEFPNLKEKIYPRKLSIYKNDCKKLQEIYQAIQTSANENKTNNQGYQFVKDFVNQYSNNGTFDPDKKMPLANELTDYYSVCQAMNISVRNTYFDNSSRKPHFYTQGNSDQYTLSHAKDICSRTVNSRFKSFYTFAKSGVVSKYNDITTKLERDRKRYDAAYSRYQEEERQLEAARNAKRAKLSSIDENSVFMYIKKIDEKWSEGRVIDTDTNYKDHKDVVFYDIENNNNTIYGTVYKYRKGSDIWYGGGRDYYKTFSDAVCAEYLWHYSITWDHNTR